MFLFFLENYKLMVHSSNLIDLDCTELFDIVDYHIFFKTCTSVEIAHDSEVVMNQTKKVKNTERTKLNSDR